MPKNAEDWGKLIAAKGLKKLPKVQNIAQSGHTDDKLQTVKLAVLDTFCFESIPELMNSLYPDSYLDQSFTLAKLNGAGALLVTF